MPRRPASHTYTQITTDLSRGDSTSETGLVRSEKTPPSAPLPSNKFWPKFWKISPFVLHLVAIGAVNAFMFLFVDGHKFNTVARTSTMGLDGSSHDGNVYGAILQSDITTIVTILASVARVCGALWAGGIAWRCVFLFMERGGVSLRGVNRMLNSLPPSPRDLRKSNFIIFSTVLLATFSLDYSSSILTGSITWKPALMHTQGVKRLLSGVVHTVPGPSHALESYRMWNETVAAEAVIAATMASVAWGGIGANSTSIRRVLRDASFPPVDSELVNVTIPYFVVDKFEWIKDHSTVTPQQEDRVMQGNYHNPFLSAGGMVALLPDDSWSPPNSNDIPEPHDVSRTQILVMRTFFTDQKYDACGSEEDRKSGVPPDVYRYQFNDAVSNCFAFAQVTYRAGGALCQPCHISSPGIVEADLNDIRELAPDPLTLDALALAASVSKNIRFSRYAMPPPSAFPTFQAQATELLARSYQAAWASLNERLGDQADDITVKLPVKTTEAVVRRSRVWIWVALHMVAWSVGVLFIVVQRGCRHPWVENPAFAALFVNGDQLRERERWGDLWEPGVDIPRCQLKLADSDRCTRFINVTESTQFLGL